VVNVDQATTHLLHRLAGVDAAALDVLLHELAEMRRRRTLGGIPPACKPWANKQLPGGPDPEYRGLT
jgi:hypothetical protein